MRNRDAIVLLSVLVALSGAALVTGGAVLTMRAGTAASRNRVAAEQARWVAEGCFAQLRSRVDAALADTSSPLRRSQIASTFEARVAGFADAFGPSCTVETEAVGSRIDVNLATADELKAALANSVSASQLTSLIGAILRSRLEVVEGEAVSRARTVRRVVDVDEVVPAPTIDSFPQLKKILGSELGPISLRFASREVLLALPGIGDEAANVIVRAREVDSLTSRLIDVLSILQRPSADTLLAHFQEFARAATVDPVAWLVRVRASYGSPAMSAVIDVRASLGRTLLIERRRDSW